MTTTKTVLISGGTKGIGKGSVIALLKEGFNVATFSRNEKNLKSLRHEIEKDHWESQFIALEADVTSEESITDLVQQVMTKFGGIDILINNAGIGYFRDADQLDIDRFQSMIQTNIVGVALLTKHTVPVMKKNKAGLIINIASISGKVAFANGEFYSATKFGVKGYSQAIRAELAPFGIKVATICPGMIKTDFFDAEELERRKKLWNGNIPQMLEVNDIARIISMICNQSEHADIQDITIMPF